MRRRQLDLLRCVTLALLATPSWSATLFQPSSVVLKDGRPARIECRVGGSSTRDTTFYWYRQKGDTELLWILYYQDTSTQEKAESFAGRFSSTKQRDRQAAFLIITETSRADEATYFCAVWSAIRGATIKVFGAGTKLIVSDTPAKQPEVNVFRASNDRVACVAYGFFPDVIKFEWKKKVGGTTESLGANEKDEQLDLPITKIEDGSDKYSATSLLIYKGGNPSYKFVCVVNHEGFTNPTEFTEAIPDAPVTSSGSVPAAGDLETDDCKAQYAEGLDFQPFNVATLSYTLFILKSVVYCAVVVFLTYQSKSV